jgi:3-hydroxybutyryl-CoA dehydrogenase
MGAGFAQVLALHGVQVAVADARPELAAAARERLVAQARAFEDRGLLGAGSAERIARAVTAAASVGAAAQDAGLVLEAVTEDPAVKRAVYAEAAEAAPRDAVIATNTSAIPIRELAAGVPGPERFLGTHWFNPPQWVPCVEVIPGPTTDAEVVGRVVALLRRLGKRPVTVGDAAGFVANRIQFAMFREAAACVADGVASPEQVDEVVRSSFGYRLPFFGPFTIADMAGLDVYAGAYGALERDLGSRFSVPPQVRELVAAGRLGTKAGGGFLDLSPEQAAALVEQRDAAYVALAALIEELGVWDGPGPSGPPA